MKKIILLVAIAMVTIACNHEVKKEKESPLQEVVKKEVVKDRSLDLPQDIAAVLKAHGGIKAFDEKNTLVFELVNIEGNEKHTTDLKTRFARIETDKFSLGFDGKEAWIQQDSTYFKGNPRFYHNLMFYFYAMPFVLADEGISYEKVEDLIVNEIKYPGYKISYSNGVGDSPKDNYFLYYDAATKQMRFLGYTVTFFSDEVSEKISLIDYSDWATIDGLLLPKTLKWMQYSEGKVGPVKSERNFINVTISKEKKDITFYQKPTSIK